MGQFYRVILGAALFCACSKTSTPSPDAPVAIPRARARLEAKPAQDPRFDAQGNLKPGSLRVGWLEIPVGFTKRPGSTEHDGAFEADDLTVQQVRQYVIARAHADKVSYTPTAEYHQGSHPTHTQLPLAPLNITIMATDRARNQVRLLVEDLTPTSPTMASPAQAAEVLAKARARQE